MPIPSNPSYLLDVIGSQADVFSIPETTPEGSGALSYASGWPKIVATALSAGGLPPQREYFNAVNKLLSQHIFFLQSGGVYPWNSALDYNPGARVMGSNGIVYVAVAASGPDVSEVGAQNPTTDSANTYWQTLAASLMSSSGGLVVDPETGQASVDFSQMPTDKFEALLQSIRVPIWLTSNLTIYVNGTTGSDTLDEGRGLSAGMPFKTIQAAINYITDNYNFSRFNATISIAPGTYSVVQCPTFQRTTGKCILAGTNADDVIITLNRSGSAIIATGGEWDVSGVTCLLSTEEAEINGYLSGVRADPYSEISLSNVKIKASQSSQVNRLRLVHSESFGKVNIGKNCEITASCTYETNSITALLCYSYGTINLNYDQTPEDSLVITGDYQFIASAEGGDIVRQYPSLGTVSGEATGQRYRSINAGRINTYGGGPDYFPGNSAGYVESSTYSWYK